jgi:hypothetical protein
MLLLCRSSLVPERKSEPLNVLPPSRGMMFMRTPPADCSAEPAEVSTVTS